jgi:hypothetical protein
MAAIVLARKLAAGDAMAPGAFTAAGVLPLDAFEPEFARWGMITDIVDDAPTASPAALVAAGAAVAP